MAQIPPSVKLLRATYAGYLACVGYLAFSPGGETPGGVIAWLHDLLPFSESQIEVGLNVLMFVPLSLVGWLVVRPGVLFWTVAAVLLSTVIELVQLTIPGRVTTLSDVVANTAGAFLGALACALWGTRARG